jgi:hypothetical protein
VNRNVELRSQFYVRKLRLNLWFQVYGCFFVVVQEGVVKATIETKHFVLVHGGGLGAWCWYKSIALLEEAGLVATAIDLKGSGIDSTDPNQINSMAVYVKPLLDFLEQLGSDDKVGSPNAESSTSRVFIISLHPIVVVSFCLNRLSHVTA